MQNIVGRGDMAVYPFVVLHATVATCVYLPIFRGKWITHKESSMRCYEVTQFMFRKVPHLAS